TPPPWIVPRSSADCSSLIGAETHRWQTVPGLAAQDGGLPFANSRQAVVVPRSRPGQLSARFSRSSVGKLLILVGDFEQAGAGPPGCPSISARRRNCSARPR